MHFSKLIFTVQVFFWSPWIDLFFNRNYLRNILTRWLLAALYSLLSQVYCEMRQTGGWIVIQRRSGGAVSFERGWAQYRHGFGSLTCTWLVLSRLCVPNMTFENAKTFLKLGKHFECWMKIKQQSHPSSTLFIGKDIGTKFGCLSLFAPLIPQTTTGSD